MISSDISIGFPDIVPDARTEETRKRQFYVIFNTLEKLCSKWEKPVIYGTSEELEPFKQLVEKGLIINELPEGRTPQWYAAENLKKWRIQWLIWGNISTTWNMVRALLKNLGIEKGRKRISSYFLMKKSDRDFIFSDWAISPNPTPEELLEIIQLSAENAVWHGILNPKITLLDGWHENEKIKETWEMVQGWLRESGIDNISVNIWGTFQEAYESGTDIFIFHNLNAGNIAYKIAEKMVWFDSLELWENPETWLYINYLSSWEKDCLFAYGTRKKMPNAEELMQTAFDAILVAREKWLPLKVAFLSYSTAWSGIGKKWPESSLIPIIEAASKMWDFLREKWIHDVEIIDKETQFDAAFFQAVWESKWLDTSDATIFVFPDIHTGSICCDIPTSINGLYAIGPLIQWLAWEAHDVSRSVDDETLVKIFYIIKDMILSKR